MANITGTSGDELLNGTADDDFIEGLGGNDTLFADDGNDTLDGGAGDFSDLLYGGLGMDSLYGGDGRDILTGGAGADLLDGGEGDNWITYSDSGAGVTVDLATGIGIGGDAEGDTIIQVSSVIGSAFDDILIGNDGPRANFLIGGAGNDQLFGGLGADWLDGGAGDDRLDGSGGNGGFGDDRLIGGAGADIFVLGGDTYVRDFEDGLDRLEIDSTFAANFEALIIGDGVTGITVSYNNGDGDMLLGRIDGISGPEQLDETDFIFV